jgi:flagellar hook capping protein FlgD
LARFLPAVLVVALLGGSAAAFAVTERLKLVRSPIFATQVDKVVSPESDQTADIAFRLRKPDRLTLTIVDSNDHVVRTLIDSKHVGAGRRLAFWNGRDDAGTPVADGAYRPRVHLAGQHRTIVLPNTIVVDTKKPRISLVRSSLENVSPDGDAHNDYLTVFFKTSEPARAVLYENGRRAVLLKSFNARKLLWGRRNGMPTKPGLYRLRLAAVDQAGNTGPRTPVFTVRIRYIALAKHVIRARAGGRIVANVSTDAHGYTWRIGPRHGRASARRLVLAAGAPGRYELVVSERGHKAAATVVVSP